jgi:hypothetical protein
MTMHEASQYMTNTVLSFRAFWHESTSQKRLLPAEIITTNMHVNRLATRLEGNIGKYVCVGCEGGWGAGSIHGVPFRGLDMCHRVWVLRELRFRWELDRVSTVVRSVS